MSVVGQSPKLQISSSTEVPAQSSAELEQDLDLVRELGPQVSWQEDQTCQASQEPPSPKSCPTGSEVTCGYGYKFICNINFNGTCLLFYVCTIPSLHHYCR